MWLARGSLDHCLAKLVIMTNTNSFVCTRFYPEHVPKKSRPPPDAAIWLSIFFSLRVFCRKFLP